LDAGNDRIRGVEKHTFNVEMNEVKGLLALLSEVFFTSDSYHDGGMKHQHPAEQKDSSLRSE
jgi:hypothetical protein